jgi:deferrochelatase/peroxidase EfeB
MTGCPLVSEKGPEYFPSCDPHRPVLDADPKLLPDDARLSEAINRSHIHRARQFDDAPDFQVDDEVKAAIENRRIFRQGYHFLEPHDSFPGFRVGLNFVSFQSAPGILTHIFGDAGWLGYTNFGGNDDFRLVSASAAGFFFVPPRNGAPPLAARERFPGERILTLRRAELVRA